MSVLAMEVIQAKDKNDVLCEIFQGVIDAGKQLEINFSRCDAPLL